MKVNIGKLIIFAALVLLLYRHRRHLMFFAATIEILRRICDSFNLKKLDLRNWFGDQMIGKI